MNVGPDWSMSGNDERKALYRTVRRLMKELRLHLDQVFEQAEGRPARLGVGYEDNFRAGRIAQRRAKAVYDWIVRQHPGEAARLDAEIGQLYAENFPTSQWEQAVNTHGVFGCLELKELMRQEQWQLQVETRKPEPIQARARLMQPYAVHLSNAHEGLALGFQCVGGLWIPLPLGVASLGVRLGHERACAFPHDPSGSQQPYFLERSDTGLRRMVVAIMPEAIGKGFEAAFSRDRLAPPDLLDRLASELVGSDAGKWSLYRLNIVLLAF